MWTGGGRGAVSILDMGMAVDWGRAQVSTLGHCSGCLLGEEGVESALQDMQMGGEWVMPALRDMGVDVDWMGVRGGGGGHKLDNS